MASIKFGNSYSKIEGMTAMEDKELRSLLSYTVEAKAAFFAKSYRPRKKCLIDKKGEFPTGLLPRVTSYFRNIGNPAVIQRPIPQHKHPHATNLKVAIRPYPSQSKAIILATRANRGTISMPTGSGKSLVIAMLVARLGVKTLVVVPSLEIKKQLQNTIEEFLTDASGITVENIDSPSLKNLKHFECLIIDEAHHVAAKTYQKLNKTAWLDIHYRFFLTATPFRNDTEETLLFESIAGSVIYSLSYKEAVDAGYILPIEAYYCEVPKVQTDAYTWAQVYSQLVVKNDLLNAQVCEILKNLDSNGVSTLCLVKEVAHGRTLSELSGMPFVHGQDEESRDYIRQFNSGKIATLIATTGVMGEGIDTKPCEYVIIAGLGKAKSQFMQQVGRAVRVYPGKTSAKVIIFKNRSHKFTSRHFKQQCDILRDEYGAVPLKVGK